MGANTSQALNRDNTGVHKLRAHTRIPKEYNGISKQHFRKSIDNYDLNNKHSQLSEISHEVPYLRE